MAPHFAIEDQQAVYDQLLRALKGAHCRRRSAIKLNVAVSEGEKLERIGKVMMNRFGRTSYWLKFKNPAAPAVRREAEEDWGRQ
jgi:hypothetical protein